MADDPLSDHYQMLEELGSTSTLIYASPFSGSRLPSSHDINVRLTTSCSIGGSFGTVYKAIDKATGEIVAVKHVRLQTSFSSLSHLLDQCRTNTQN
jgi:hypothetical protein